MGEASGYMRHAAHKGKGSVWLRSQGKGLRVRVRPLNLGRRGDLRHTALQEGLSTKFSTTSACTTETGPGSASSSAAACQIWEEWGDTAGGERTRGWLFVHRKRVTQQRVGALVQRAGLRIIGHWDHRPCGINHRPCGLTSRVGS
eukprot:750894-Prymnesium_polylepis.1